VDLAAMNGMRTDILAARGDFRQAAAALRDTLRLQRTVVRQPYRTSVAVRSFGSLRLLLRRAPPDAEVLADLQRAFEALPDEDSLAQQMRLERARLLGGSWPHPAGRVSWAYRLRVAPPARGTFESFVLLLMRPTLTRVTRGELPLFADTIRVAEQPWPQKIDAARALGPGFTGGRTHSFASWRYAPPRWAIGFFQSVLPLAGEELAIRRTAIATLAAERYRREHAGAVPQSLDALVPRYLNRVPLDPFSGDPIRYRYVGDSYTIYSIGRNGEDDAGALDGFGSGQTSTVAARRDFARRDLGIRIPLR
jgi:hypothetical protein